MMIGQVGNLRRFKINPQRRWLNLTQFKRLLKKLGTPHKSWSMQPELLIIIIRWHLILLSLTKAMRSKKKKKNHNNKC